MHTGIHERTTWLNGLGPVQLRVLTQACLRVAAHALVHLHCGTQAHVLVGAKFTRSDEYDRLHNTYTVYCTKDLTAPRPLPGNFFPLFVDVALHSLKYSDQRINRRDRGIRLVTHMSKELILIQEYGHKQGKRC